MTEDYIKRLEEYNVSGGTPSMEISKTQKYSTLAKIQSDEKLTTLKIDSNKELTKLRIESDKKLAESNDKHSTRMYWLTWALVFVGIMQIIATVVSTYEII